MKKLFFIFLSILFSNLGFSQSLSPEVISSAGDFFSGANITLSWTLGEPVIETFSSQDGQIVLTQGFQQPEATTEPGGFKIEGFLYYAYKGGNKAMPNIKIYLLNSENKKADSAITAANGAYTFNNVVNGIYKLTPYITLATKNAWDPVDALWVLRNYIQILKLQPFRLKASDVAPKVGTYDPVDALFIQRRYISIIKKFAQGDWLTETPSVTVNNGNISQNILALAYGDVAADWKAFGSKKINQNVFFINNDVILTSNNSIIEIPVKVNRNLDLGALGLYIKYPSDMLTIKDITSELPGLIYNVTPEDIRISWANSSDISKTFNNNEILLKIKVLVNNINSDITLQPGIESVLANNEGEVYNNEFINIPKISTESNLSGNYLGQNIPNPFRINTEIDFLNAEDANVNITVYNLLGKKIAEIVNGQLTAGYHKISFDGSNLAEGVYLYKMTVKNAQSEYIKTRLMVISQ
ncbi:MAG: T9SS type A sorting domain-containing protein [Bacteroidales bacterium]|nr:T9SS type A sorting domain-containing protein [Bacteroidales bacterium]